MAKSIRRTPLSVGTTGMAGPSSPRRGSPISGRNETRFDSRAHARARVRPIALSIVQINLDQYTSRCADVEAAFRSIGLSIELLSVQLRCCDAAALGVLGADAPPLPGFTATSKAIEAIKPAPA